MPEVVIVDAVRSPFGKRGGGLSTTHSVELLGSVLGALLERTGIDPATVGQVVGGCVGQVGMQAMNVTRNAWLTEGLPISVAATTVDAQCGSSQQASNLAYALIAAGVVDVAIGCGVELLSRVPMGSTVPKDGPGKPVTRKYWAHHEYTSQFEGAERIADTWGIGRAERGDADGEQGRGGQGHDPGGARRAQAHRATGRGAHGRDLVADLRRRLRRSPDDRRPGRGGGTHADG